MKKAVASLFKLLPKPLRKHKIVRILLRLGLLDIEQTATFNDGAASIINIRDAEARNVFLTHHFESGFFDIATPFCRNAKLVFDIGANSGFCTFGIAAHVKNPVEFHLFEANPKLIDLLQKSIRIQPAQHSFKIAQGCVSDHEGSSGIGFTEDYLCARVTGEGSIPNIVLDSYVKQHRIESIDFLKMDIEGSEPAALRGWSQFLSAQKIKTIYIEVCEGTLKNFGSTTADLIKLIESFGYTCFYCKEPEISHQPNKKTIHVNGTTLHIAPCTSENIPSDFQSDVLAFPKDSAWLAEAKNAS